MNILFIGNGFDIEHNINFRDFLIWCKKNQKLKSYKDLFDDKNYKKFCKTSYLWSDFEGYLKFVVEGSTNIKYEYFILKISYLLEEWLKEKNKHFNYQSSSKILKLINKNNIQTIISFNYTETPEIYGFKKLTFSSITFRKKYNKICFWKNKYVKLHHFKTKLENCILGHDNSHLIEKDKFINNWSDGNNFNPKKQVLETIINNKNIRKIIFFGFSFGESDLKIIKFVKKFDKQYKNRETIIYYLKDIKKIQNKLKKYKIKNKKIKWIDWNKNI